MRYYVREQSILTGNYVSSTLFGGTYAECVEYVEKQEQKDSTRYEFIKLVIQTA